MSLVGTVLIVSMIGGVVGARMQIKIAMWSLSTETIDSPSMTTRLTYRFFLFAMAYFVSFVTSPLVFLIDPFSRLVPMARDSGFAGALLTVLCLPLAILLFWLNLSFIRSGDKKKMAGREALLVKMGLKTAPKWWEKRERRW